jgi:hypothetical protein
VLNARLGRELTDIKQLSDRKSAVEIKPDQNNFVIVQICILTSNHRGGELDELYEQVNVIIRKNLMVMED